MSSIIFRFFGLSLSYMGWANFCDEMLELDIKKLERVSEAIPFDKITTEGNEIYDRLLWEYDSLGGGAGLSAPQIGIYKRVFLWTKDRKRETLRVAINPKIFYKDLSDALTSIEGCYSVPERVYEIERFKDLEMEF